MFPSNEAETIELYRVVQGRLGWPIINLQTRFPDAVIENGDDKLVVEFEFEAKNFKRHGHDASGCDLIICWRNNWPNSPLPVMALEDCAADEVNIIRQLLRGSVPKSELMRKERELELHRKEVDKLHKELLEIKLELSEEREGFQWYDELLQLAIGEDRYWEILGELALKEVERQHGLPEETLKYNYGWLPTKRKEKLEETTDKLKIFFMGFLPGFVLAVIALLTRGL